MEKRKYQVLLTEEFLDTSLFPSSAFVGGYTSRPVLEIASSDSTYAWQAYDFEFYTKIDGTHTLSFKLEEKYFDEDRGALVENELLKHLTNKCKLEVRRENFEKSPDKNGNIVFDTYFMVINDREDKEDKGIISYSYSCTDAYIEELSKTGYEISFSDDIDVGNGVGTIHDFAYQVADGSDWKYREDKTGTLIEYLTELQWNDEQKRFDEVHIPVPTHPFKFVPEIKEYSNQLETCASVEEINGEYYYQPYYCAEMFETVTTTPTRNLVSNGDEFLDTIGWTSFRKSGTEPLTGGEYILEPIKKGEDNYYLNISGKYKSYLVNDTMTSNNTMLEAYTPYIFKYSTEHQETIFQGVYLTSKNPFLKGIDIADSEVAFVQALKPNTYYVIKPTKNIPHPYLILLTKVTGKANLVDIELFKAQGNTEEAQLALMKSLHHGDQVTASQLGQMVLPESDLALNAYTDRQLKYFSRKNYRVQLLTGKDVQIDPYADDEVEFYSFDDVNNARYKIGKVDGVTTILDNAPLPIKEVSSLPDKADENQVYFLSTDNYYYQYYLAEKDGAINGEWGYARCGTGKNDKIRTLSIEKSNRFNIIQELAELFKVWPIFDVHRNEDGALEKEFWFKESALRDNFAGFHKGVNLSNITRKLESDEVVTKMYVEDIEKSFITDGKISIARSAYNPWGERYYYNFRYYIEQNLVSKQIDEDKETLYEKIKALNKELETKNEEYITYKTLYENNKKAAYQYSIQISASVENIAKVQETIDGLSDKGADEDLPELKLAQESIERYQKQKDKNSKEYKKLTQQNKEIEQKLSQLSADTTSIMTQKKTLINEFETKYSQFIKEGTWSDSSYADDNIYYLDSQKVSNTSAIPKASWTINIVDGIITEDLKDYTFKVGDKTFLVDNEFFKNNEINRDYKFEILITGYKDYFDAPHKNQIEVRNYQTSFEDLFQRISASTQTLELNEQIYDKAARFTANGEIESDILQKSLVNNNFTLASTDDNSYELDIEGLKLQSIPNPSKKLRITSDGLFISNKINKETGQPEWTLGVTAEGINASIITAGEIDTSLVKIFSKGQETFSWNELGISAYHTVDGNVSSKNFTRFDQFGLYVIEDIDGFNYSQNGGLWWENLPKGSTPEQKIIDNATVSLTKEGFRLNVIAKDSHGEKVGSITLGKLYNGNTPLGYGLQIKRGSNTIVQLTDTNSQIGGFRINDNWLWGDRAGINGYAEDSTTAIFAGEEWISDNRPKTMPFYVTGNGNAFINYLKVGGTLVGEGDAAHFENYFTFEGTKFTGVNNFGINPAATGTSKVIYYGSPVSTASTQMPFCVTGDGYVYCKKLFINGQEVTPGGGGGGGGGTLAYPCPSYTKITTDWSEEHGGIDFATKGMINNNIIASETGTVIRSRDITSGSGTIGEEPHGYYEDSVINYNSATPTSTTYRSYGRYIAIKLDRKIENKFAYVVCAHLNYRGTSRTNVTTEGQRVTRGQVIGLSGTTGNSTGPHVHFELRLNTIDDFDSATKVNPRPYLEDGGYVPPGDNNKEKIYNYLTQIKGYSKSMTIGIMANIQAESDFNPASYTPLDVDDEGGGLCGWWGVNFRAMVNSNPDWRTNIAGQLEFLDYDLQNRNKETYANRMRQYYPDFSGTFYQYILSLGSQNSEANAKNIAEAFCKVFEYPQSMDTQVTQRRNNAHTLWEYFTDTTGPVIQPGTE